MQGLFCFHRLLSGLQKIQTSFWAGAKKPNNQINLYIGDVSLRSTWRGMGKTETYKNSKAPDGQGPLLTNYKPKLWEELLGKGSNLHRVVSLYRFPIISATGTRRCVCQKFHHPTLCFVLKNALPFYRLLDTNLGHFTISCKYFNKNILFLFLF